MRNECLRKFLYVEYPLALSYLFTPSEARFILHMINFEYLKKHGFLTNWSNAEYIKRIGISKNAFNNCVKKLIKMKLLKKWNNKLGNRVYYSFDLEVYTKLIYILSCTNNVDELIKFCNISFKQGRLVEDITEKEIIELKHTRLLSSLKYPFFPDID